MTASNLICAILLTATAATMASDGNSPPGTDPTPAGAALPFGFVRRSKIYHIAPQDNKTHVARVMQTDVSLPGAGPFQHTTDPNWDDLVHGGGGGQTERLPYRTQDNSVWEVKVRCTGRVRNSVFEAGFSSSDG